jgi:hypothetical protein
MGSASAGLTENRLAQFVSLEALHAPCNSSVVLYPLPYDECSAPIAIRRQKSVEKISKKIGQ